MLFEFLNMTSITEDVLFDKTISMIDKLMKYFYIENSNEKSKACVMEELYKKLTNKKFQKQCSPLFVIKEVMSSTDILTTKEGEAPRVVMYTSIEEEIATAYIVTDETIKIKVPQPTVSRVIICLLSAYYVWHIQYPTCYTNVLKYIDQEILITSLQGCSIVVTKFIRECNNTLKTKLSDDKSI